MGKTLEETVNDLVARVDKLEKASAPIIPIIDPPPNPRYWLPSLAQAKKDAERWGVPVEQLTDSFQLKITACDPQNVTELEARAAYGIDVNGKRKVWKSEDLDRQRGFANRLFDARDVPSIEALCTNAASPGVQTRAVIYAALTGECSFDPASFMPPVYRVPRLVPGEDGSLVAQGYAETVEDVALYVSQGQKESFASGTQPHAAAPNETPENPES